MRRFPSDVDPRLLQVEPDNKRRRRKRRDLPDPPDRLKAVEARAVAALRKMPPSPGIILQPREDGERGWIHTAPHSDWNLWDTQLHAAFGTRSRSLVKLFLGQLKSLCRTDRDDAGVNDWKPNETDLNAILALVTDLRPRTASETTLAAQMAAVHLLMMNLARDAFNSGGMVMEKQAALSSKLARTYTMQLEQFRLMRGGKKPTIRQAITVKRETHYHQHHHLHDHRPDQGARGVQENDGECHAQDGGTIHAETTARPRELSALPGPDETRRVVPIASRKGKAAV